MEHLKHLYTLPNSHILWEIFSLNLLAVQSVKYVILKLEKMQEKSSR